MKPASGSALHRSRVVLGILGGALCGMSLSLFLACAVFWFFLHHMFIVGAHAFAFWLLLASPLLLLGAGIALSLFALRNRSDAAS